MSEINEYTVARPTHVYFMPYWIANAFNRRAIPFESITNYNHIANNLCLEDQADLVACNRLIIDELRISDDIMARWSFNSPNPIVTELSLLPERIQLLRDRLSCDTSEPYFNVYMGRTADIIIVILNKSLLSSASSDATTQRYFSLTQSIIINLDKLIPYKMIPVLYPGVFRKYLQYLCTFSVNNF
jgi:hypothetical protein